MSPVSNCTSALLSPCDKKAYRSNVATVLPARRNWMARMLPLLPGPPVSSNALTKPDMLLITYLPGLRAWPTTNTSMLRKRPSVTLTVKLR